MHRVLPVLFVALSFVRGFAEEPVPEPVRIRIVCSLPGSGAQTADVALAQPLMKQFMGLEGLKQIRSESREGDVELYLTFAGKAGATELERAVEERAKAAEEKLPPGATTGKAAVLKKAEEIPSNAPKQVPSLVVKIDRTKAAAFGLKASEIEALIAKPYRELKDSPDAVEKLGKLSVGRKDRPVPLSVVATFTMEMVPDLVSRNWP